MSRKIKPITLDDLKKMFIATGSQVFGEYNGNSDYDFLVPPQRIMEAWEILNSRITKRDMYYSEEIYSYYFHIEHGKKINFIIFKDNKLYKAWRYATMRMTQFRIAVSTRKERHIIFQGFVQYYLEENK